MQHLNSQQTTCMSEMLRHQQQVEEAVAFLRSTLPQAPQLLIQTGTGLGGMAQLIDSAQNIPYAAIPHFPTATVASHAGSLVFGYAHGKSVALLQGRLHCYEGYSAQQVAFPIRALALLGAQTAIITNAAGGLNPVFQPGNIMLIQDHINLLGDNPLRGANIEAWGPRFPDLSRPYDQGLGVLALDLARDLGLGELQRGVYVCVPGPSLETAAETKFLRLIGADAVGMSSIPEVITAIHAGMRVLGLSVIANVNNPDELEPILLEDIIQGAQQAEPALHQLILALIERL